MFGVIRILVKNVSSWTVETDTGEEAGLWRPSNF